MQLSISANTRQVQYLLFFHLLAKLLGNMSPAEHTTSVQTQDSCTMKYLSIVPEGIVFPPQLSFICSDAKKSPTQCIIKLGARFISHFPTAMFRKTAVTTNQSTEVPSKLISM